MEHGAKHSTVERRFMCMKHQAALHKGAIHCRDPKIYCKYRSACPVWFMEKRGGKEIDA